MGTLAYVYTVTGSESIPGTFYFAGIQNWSGAFTITLTLSTPATSIANLTWSLYRSSGGTACLTDGLSIFSGSTGTSDSWTVGNPPLAWHCGDWDSFSIGYAGATNRLPTGATLTITFDGAGITPSTGICAYGTEPIDPDVSVIDRIGAAISIIRINPGSLWMWGLAAASLTQPIAVAQLCSTPPPPDEDLNPLDFTNFLPPFKYTNAHRKVGIKITRKLWDQYCRCVPAPGGSPPAVGPGPTNITQPTWYITNNYNNISNYDIANTLNWIWQFQFTNQYAINNTWEIGGDSSTSITEIGGDIAELGGGGCVPAEYVEGAVHADLLGAGRIALGEGVVGFKVEVVERNTGELVLSGQPMYLWNMGWISILADGDAMVDEKRVTREGYLWFPCGLRHATEFAYTLRDFTRCRVTELVRPS